MNSNIDLHNELQEHLDKLPIGFPKTESGVEIKILQHIFEPFEAKVALCLSLGNTSVLTVQKRMKRKFKEVIELDDLSKVLDKMYLSGSINRSKREPFKYSNAMLAIGMFEYQVGHLSKEFIEMLHQYFDEGFNDEFFRSSLPQLRASPHMNAIVPEYNIATYDNMRKLVKESDQTIAVANCVCKEMAHLGSSFCDQSWRCIRRSATIVFRDIWIQHWQFKSYAATYVPCHMCFDGCGRAALMGAFVPHRESPHRGT